MLSRHSQNPILHSSILTMTTSRLRRSERRRKRSQAYVNTTFLLTSQNVTNAKFAETTKRTDLIVERRQRITRAIFRNPKTLETCSPLIIKSWEKKTRVLKGTKSFVLFKTKRRTGYKLIPLPRRQLRKLQLPSGDFLVLTRSVNMCTLIIPKNLPKL